MPRLDDLIAESAPAASASSEAAASAPEPDEHDRAALEEQLGVRERRRHQTNSADVVQQNLRLKPNGELAADSDDDDWMDGPQRAGGGRCVPLLLASLALTILGTAGLGLAQMYAPWPVECDAISVNARRFKVDVSDFWAPRLQSTVQFVLELRNRNPLRAMVLESCKLEVFEAATGLRLGSVQQGPALVSPFNSRPVTLALKDFGSSLPPPEQRRISELFLRHKALLLTIVATSLSKIPSSSSSSSSSKPKEATTQTSTKALRLELRKEARDPFFQRPAPKAQESPPPEGGVHDVPV